MRALLLAMIVLVSRVAAADRLRSHRLDRASIHLAGEDGAINTDVDFTVTLELRADGKVQVRSKGSSDEQNLYVEDHGSRNVDDAVHWTTRWSGTYTATPELIELEL